MRQSGAHPAFQAMAEPALSRPGIVRTPRERRRHGSRRSAILLLKPTRQLLVRVHGDERKRASARQRVRSSPHGGDNRRGGARRVSTESKRVSLDRPKTRNGALRSQGFTVRRTRRRKRDAVVEVGDIFQGSRTQVLEIQKSAFPLAISRWGSRIFCFCDLRCQDTWGILFEGSG